MSVTKARNKSRCTGILVTGNALPNVQVDELEPKQLQILPPNTALASHNPVSTEIMHLFMLPMAAVPFFTIQNGVA